MASPDTREQEIRFAECLISDLMSRHPGLTMYRRFSHNTDRVPFFSEHVGKSVMYTWHVTRYSIETKLRNDFPRFAKDETLLKNYILEFSSTINNSTNCDYTRIVEFSAVLLEVISFLCRRGITHFVKRVPHYWHLMFTRLVSREFYNTGGWETLTLLSKERAESYNNNILEIRKQYFMTSTERSLKNFTKENKPLNSSESSSCLANPDSSANTVTTGSSEAADIVVKSKDTSAVSESLSRDTSQMSLESLKSKTDTTGVLSKLAIKSTAAEKPSMDTKSRTSQSSEMASLNAKVSVKTVKPKPGRMSSEFSSATSRPAISPHQMKKPGATGVKPKQPLKSPSVVATKPVPLTSPSPTKKLSGPKSKQVPPVTASSSQVKIYTQMDAVSKHIARMGHSHPPKQTASKGATQTTRKPSAVPAKLVPESISCRQTPKPKEKDSAESSSKTKSVKKPETKPIPVGYQTRLTEKSPVKVKKN